VSRRERDPYRILHVDPDADPDVIAAAYRVLARKLHPDTAVEGDPVIERRMAELNWAWTLLRDPERRRTYDRDRRFAQSGRHGPPPAPAAEAEGRSHGVPRPDVDYDPGAVRLDFGRYHGLTLRQILQRDPAYLEWLRRHSSGAPHREAIAQLLREHASRRR
jgi:curved DNA-binding protein CbpA